MIILIRKNSYVIIIFKKKKIELKCTPFHITCMAMCWKYFEESFTVTTIQELFLLAESHCALKNPPVGFVLELTIKLLLTLV